MAFYVDSSALVKLVVAARETPALRSWLAESPREPVACDLVRTELLRAVRRTDPALMIRAREVLDTLILIEVTSSIFDAAGRLDPSILRALDAIHVAAALDLGDELEGLVTYDDRMGEAARLNGIAAVTPT